MAFRENKTCGFMTGIKRRVEEGETEISRIPYCLLRVCIRLPRLAQIHRFLPL